MAVETITGKIRKICYHKVGKGSRSGVPFLIANLADGRTVKGEMRNPSYAETYSFVGEWRPQKYNGEDAFEFVSFEEIVEASASGVAQYLARKIRGLGPVKSAALVESFGVDTLRTLQAKAELATQV